MAFILNIETSSTLCSVALFNNANLLSFKEADNGYTHAENLHVFINDVMQEAGCLMSNLSAIAIGSGPGSYTGLRIGLSSAKGLCFALNIPLISVNSLQIMCAGIKVIQNYQHYCPLIDARRMEVYTAVFDNELKEIINSQALILNSESVKLITQFSSTCFIGNGVPKSQQWIINEAKNAKFIENAPSSAKQMGFLSYQKYLKNEFQNVLTFEPNYLKEFYTTAKIKLQ
ncbi:MAG: tRNA (adenosine(37)-N6)-threonylcarbamoyltransferase complex dimerization subunit type 1 TsaB [Bacteroidetes bacterium]|nr:tRNA (adenosine(37)-N6)-threonylcarbamoyltransferase complex dimerization subunit type 1 TsaB [Bacteroidota bacterium]